MTDEQVFGDSGIDNFVEQLGAAAMDLIAGNPNHDAHGRFASGEEASAAAHAATDRANSHSDSIKDRREVAKSALDHAAVLVEHGDHEAAAHTLRTAATHMKAQAEETKDAKKAHREAAAIHREAARLAPNVDQKLEHEHAAAFHMETASGHRDEEFQVHNTRTMLKDAYGQSKGEASASRATRAASTATTAALAASKEASGSGNVEKHYVAASEHDKARAANEKAVAAVKAIGRQGTHQSEMAANHERLAGEHRAAARSLMSGGVKAEAGSDLVNLPVAAPERSPE